ncbi:MAG: DUF6011 domain-containing protein, partial [Sporomusa sp.]
MTMRCRKCKRPIRSVASYQRGYGPVCWLAVTKESKGEQMVLELDKPSRIFTPGMSLMEQHRRVEQILGRGYK